MYNFRKKLILLGILFFFLLPLLGLAKTDKIILIQFKNSQFREKFLSSNKDAQRSQVKNLVRIKNPSFLRENWLEISSKFNSNIDYIEIGEPIKKALAPNDVYYSKQWGLNKVFAHKAWDISTGSGTNAIAVVDTGIQLDHPDLDDKIWFNEQELNGGLGVDDDSNGFIDDIYGWDFGNSDNNPSDSHSEGHGTAVAGVAGAESNNKQGIVGVDWQAKLMAVKVWQDGEIDASPEIAALGVRYAADSGAKIINMSWGTFTNWSIIKEAIEYAYAKGCVLVGATGNDGDSKVYYPAKYSQVIGVGSINSKGALSSFTNKGTGLDLAAPGEQIYSTTKNSTYGFKTGTSLAAPFVSGAISVLLSDEPNLTQSQVKSKIKGLTSRVVNYNLGYLHLFKILKIKLAKSGSSPSYLIDGNNKFALPSSSVFWQRFGFTPAYVENVPLRVLNSFQTKSSLTGLWRVSGSSEVYYIDRKSRYSVWNSSAFYSRWNFKTADIRVVSSDLLSLFPYADRLTGLVKGDSSSQVYFIDQGKKYSVWPSNAFYNRWGFSKNDVVIISQPQINILSNAGRLTGLVRGKTLPMVYLIDEGRGKPIMSMGIFYHWGWHDSDIIWLSDSFIRSLPKKSFITRLASDGSNYYWINNGAKRKINNFEQVFSNHNWNLSDIGQISFDFLSNFPSDIDLDW